MRLLYVCQGEEKELGREEAQGSCPYCRGKVVALDVETKWVFCFSPLCYKTKRKYFCSSCHKRLVLYH